MSLPGYDQWLQSGDPGQGDECPHCGDMVIDEQINWYWRREPGGVLHGIHECPSCSGLLHVYDHEGEPDRNCGCPADYHLSDCPITAYHYEQDEGPLFVGMTSSDYLDLYERLDRDGYDIDDPAHPLFGG